MPDVNSDLPPPPSRSRRARAALLVLGALCLASVLAHADIRTDALAHPEHGGGSAAAPPAAGTGLERGAEPERATAPPEPSDTTPTSDDKERADALFRRALAYDTGNGGVPRDRAKAYSLYREAAELGQVRAMLSVGLMLSEGQGVSQDPAEAVRWLRRAAERGSADGQYSVGVVYMQGQGVAQDYGQAMHWFRLAARSGHPQAMNNIGVLYANGLGIPADPVRAYAWFRLAENAGSKDGQENRMITERELSTADVAAGTVLVDQLRRDLSSR